MTSNHHWMNWNLQEANLLWGELTDHQQLVRKYSTPRQERSVTILTSMHTGPFNWF